MQEAFALNLENEPIALDHQINNADKAMVLYLKANACSPCTQQL
jgi:hypothetical protein